MSAAYAWSLVVGLAVVLVGMVGIYMRFTQRQTRSALAAVNGRAMVRLQQVSRNRRASTVPAREDTSSPADHRAGRLDRRSIPRRRLEDIILSSRRHLV